MRTSEICRKYRKTSQLIDAANHDSDAVSFFATGTDEHDMDGAIIVVKGKATALAIAEWCRRHGLVDLNKPVRDPAP